MVYVDAFPNTVKELEHLTIPMPDGVRLSARVWMPEDADRNPVPVILEYIPYRKRDGTRVRDESRHRYWAGHGYACIRLDIRGTGESEGLITDEYTQAELEDGFAAIAWIADQPWCSGAVGMTGISWGGFNSLQIAAMRPPALKAIITHCSTDDRYADDVHWMGGCMLTDAFFWGSGFYHFMTRPRDPAIAGDGWRDNWMERLENWKPPSSEHWFKHQRRDDFWRHGSICENYDDIECAVYAVGGWEDGYSNAVPRLLENLNSPSKGLVGPWGHKYPDQGIPGPSIGFLPHALRWWDHWLKGIDTGIMEEPRYTVYMQDFVPPESLQSYVPGRWVSETAWPSMRTVDKSLHLNADGLAGSAGNDTALTHYSIQALGATGGNWCPYGLGGSSPDLAIDQREDDGRSLTFDSDPMSEPLELLGAPVARLRIAIDEPQGIICVRLMDVAPDGTSRRISYGLLNLTHRNDHEHIEDMVPGEWTDISVKLNDLAHRVAEGHRVRVAISTAYWPMVWPSATPVELSLMAGQSVIDLPVRPASETDLNEVDFGVNEMAPVGPKHIIVPASSSRNIERDLATGRWTINLIEDGGRVHLNDIDLNVAGGVAVTYGIDEHDPLAAEGIWDWHTIYERDGWLVEIDSRTRVRANEDEWLIDTDVDAREDGVSVFSRSWRERITRNGV